MAAPPQESSTDSLDVPAPTAWPMVLAFGVLLLLGGLATSAALSALGALAALAGVVGWFRQVLPHEAHERVRAEPPPPPPLTTRREVVHFQVAGGSSRAWLPIEVYPVSAGILGGLAGGLTMAVLALLYGAATGRGVWYPVNLLSAGFFPGTLAATATELARFRAGSTIIATMIHLCGSVCVGLLYGAMLPILPRRPVLLGGVLAPLLWSSLLHSSIAIINPVLNEHVDWFWFVISQMGFGIVAGIVVSSRARLRTWQGAPLAVRAGLEATGLDRHPREGSER